MVSVLCSNRFVSLMDNPIDKTQDQDGDERMETERDRQHFDKEFMKAYIEDLKERGGLLLLRITLFKYVEFHSCKRS